MTRDDVHHSHIETGMTMGAAVAMNNSNSTTWRSKTSFLTPVVLCILITETAERFSYFGFRAILVLFFTLQLHYEESTAIALFAYMTCLAYLSPLLGALLADGHLGRYCTILIFGIVYLIGLCILTGGAFLDSDTQLESKRVLTFGGLFLVCLGTGGIKPCVSAFGADQVASQETTNGGGREIHQEDDFTSDRVRAFFASFYFCINLGAVTSIFVIPIIRAHYGFGAAFLTPTLFILLAMMAFLSKSSEYVHHVPTTSLATTFRLCGWILRRRLSQYALVHRYCPWIRPTQSPLSNNNSGSESTSLEATWSDGLVHDNNNNNNNAMDTEASHNQQVSDAAQALHVMPILGMLPMFWMLYDQQGSVWTLQATRMALGNIQPEQMNVVNPLLIMCFIPLFERVIYPSLETSGWNISHLRRMGWGMLLAAISFCVSGFLENVIQSRDSTGAPQVHVLWQLPQITILTVAEIFLSVTGLEFAYATSPDRLKAFLMALYLLTTAVGDLFGGLLYSSVFQDMNRSLVMYVCATLMLFNLGMFCCVARWWERCEVAKYNKRIGLSQRSLSGELNYESLSRTTSFKGVEMPRQHDATMT